MQHIDHFLIAAKFGKRYKNILEDLASEAEKRNIQRLSA